MLFLARKTLKFKSCSLIELNYFISTTLMILTQFAVIRIHPGIAQEKHFFPDSIKL